MTTIEKIRAEIERRMKKWDNLDKDLLSKNSEFGREAPINRWCELKDLLSFIESLEKENRGNPPKSNTNSLCSGLDEYTLSVDEEGLWATGKDGIRNLILKPWELNQPQGLDEAAEEYLRKYNENEQGNGGDDWEDDIIITFMAGAKWQSEQDQETIELAEVHAMLAGRMQMKEEMMKEAVEGYVNYYEASGGILMAEAQVGYPYHNGDKVKFIIVKED